MDPMKTAMSSHFGGSSKQASEATCRICDETGGDDLIFVPKTGDAHHAHKACMNGEYRRPTNRPVKVYRLYGSVSTEVGALLCSDVAQAIAPIVRGATVFPSYGVWDGDVESAVVVEVTEVTRQKAEAVAKAMGTLGCKEVLLLESDARMAHIDTEA